MEKEGGFPLMLIGFKVHEGTQEVSLSVITVAALSDILLAYPGVTTMFHRVIDQTADLARPPDDRQLPAISRRWVFPGEESP